MNKTQLFVDNTNSAVGELTLYGDEPISLDISITDIADISKTNSTFSKSFMIPADKNNNVLLNHIFNIGADSTFDASKKTPCYLLVNDLPVFTGSFQLVKINVDKTNVISYACVMYGEKVNLSKTLGSKFLTGNIDPADDLDFTGIDHTYDVDTIMASWTADSTTLGYYYPFIDYGYDLTTTDLVANIPPGTIYNGVPAVTGGLDPLLFKPAVSAKYLFDKIITDNGFSYESKFLNTEAFKQTIIPFTGTKDANLTDTYRQRFEFQAGMKNGEEIVGLMNGQARVLNFRNDSTMGNYDNSNLYTYDSGVFTNVGWYTPNRTLAMKFGVDLTVQFSGSSISSNKYITVSFIRDSYIVGGSNVPFDVQTYDFGIPTLGMDYQVSFESPQMNDPYSTTGLYPTIPGEHIYVLIEFSGGAGSNASNVKVPSYFYNTILNKQLIGSDIQMSEYVPKKIKQLDFIKSIITMFNLMVIPSKDNPNKLIFEPREDYYAEGQVKDWTYKVDNTDKIEETLLSEQQNKQILFTYKADKDFYNTDYTEKTSKVFGEYTEDINNEWVDGTKKIEIIFSPTPIDKVINSIDVFLPKICSKDANTGVFGKTESNIRFLRKNATLMPTVNSFKMYEKTAQFTYPYCGHLDHPTLSTIDYNFGTINYTYYEELKFLTPNNLINNHWRQYLDDISDKNSKMIKLKIKLTPNDIEQFNYNDIIFIDRLTDDGGHYFIVNKINYIATSELASTVELIKIQRSPKPNRLLMTQSIPPLAMRPINTLILGNNETYSKNTIISGNRNTIQSNSDNALIIGNGNTVRQGASNVILLGVNDFVVEEAGAIIVGGTRFLPGGRQITLCNDIDSGEDVVLNPFNVAPYNDIDSAEDAVLGIGGVSQRNDIDSLEDLVY